MTFFLSHRPGFSDFPFFTVIKCPIRPFYTGKTTISEKNSLIRQLFYSVHPFAHIRQHYFSKYWRGPMHGPSPHLKFWGDRPPQVSAPACCPSSFLVTSFRILSLLDLPSILRSQLI